MLRFDVATLKVLKPPTYFSFDIQTPDTYKHIIKQIKTHLLQIPQWCVLAGLGIMHFLQTDTTGPSCFSYDKIKVCFVLFF